MVSLVSPGVSVQVIDESVYAPTAVATVPLVVFASAQDKMTPSNTTAAGTIKANAGKLNLISSQRELVSTFGVPQFYKDSNGTPLHGYEINEYGLMAAYSALGVSNRVYMIRADVDLAQLVGTTNRPTAAPANGTVWLDLADTRWGIFEWDYSMNVFTNINAPILINSTSQLVGNSISGAPLNSIGSIGQYAIVVANVHNPVYVKCYDNTWQALGSYAWQSRTVAVASPYTNPTINASHTIKLNTVEVSLTAATIDNVVSRINNQSSPPIPGVTAINNNGILELFITGQAASDGTNADGKLHIEEGTGTLAANLGLTPAYYYAPALQMSKHTEVPAWKANQVPHPSGSVWIKTTSPNTGANWVVKVYNSLTEQWNVAAAPIFAGDTSANAALDPNGGGKNIAAGTFYVATDPMKNVPITAELGLHVRAVAGPLVITGTAINPSFVNSSFSIGTSLPGATSITNNTTVSLTNGDNATAFVTKVLAKNLPYLTASVTANGAIQLTHTSGGQISLANVSGTPLSTAGFTGSTQYVTLRNNNTMLASNWVSATYTASTATPAVDPADGTYWYDSATNEVDIMIHDGTAWKGYQTVTNDTRGYNLHLTDPAGPIVAAAMPME